MKLPRLHIRLTPDLRCVRCGQLGYSEDKSTLCLGCLNISLLRFVQKSKVALRESAARGEKP
jgi:hypothetical protein